MEAWRQELYHHGIKGQRWGVRKGPPYPLDAKEHSAAEKKAGWRSSIKKTAQKVAKRVTDPERIKRAATVASAYSRVATTYTLSSMFHMQLSSPAIQSYAKAARDLHDTLSSNTGSAMLKKKPRQIKGSAPQPKVLSKPNEPSELHQTPDSPVASFFAKFNPAMRNNLQNCKDYTIKNKEGQKIGEFSTELKNNGDEMNINWMGVRSKYGGKGHAQSAMRLAIEDARKQGVKYVTLEVPTDSPNARHIYEKLGFKETEKGQFTEDDVWGGLTEMRLDL